MSKLFFFTVFFNTTFTIIILCILISGAILSFICSLKYLSYCLFCDTANGVNSNQIFFYILIFHKIKRHSLKKML